MSLDDLKQKAMTAALKVMQTPTAQAVMSDKRVQDAVGKAMQASFRLQADVRDLKKDVAHTLGFATLDDLKEMKRNLERVERTQRKMKDEQKGGGK